MNQQASGTGPVAWPPPRSAYIHIPFCRHRCGYCNFSVVAGRDDLADRMLDAIDAELAGLQQPEIETLFIGGGTPTHLRPSQLERLLRMLGERFRIASGAEWSVEANPEDITREKLQLLVDHGVNRISLGVQSFQPHKLKTLERGHGGDAATRAIELAASFIPNVSLDLIFAAPGESLDDWQNDLRLALSLPIQHLSTYTLTFEKGTSFWTRREKGLLAGVGEEDEIAMYQLARELTATAGLLHYEVSNYARPGYACRHNLAYWRGGGWYAAGPGAARFVDGRREVNHRSATTYLKRIESGWDATSESELLSRSQFGRELAAFGVRLIEGIDLRETEQRAGIGLRSLCRPAIERMVDAGLLLDDGVGLRLSERGLLFADTVASELLSG